MAKHRFQRTQTMQAMRLLLVGALVSGWGISPSWAGQQSSRRSLPSPRAAQATGQKRANTAPAKPAQTPTPPKPAPAPPKPAQAPTVRKSTMENYPRPVRPVLPPRPPVSRKPSVPTAETVRAAGPKRPMPTPVEPVRTTTIRKGPTESSSGSVWGEGKRDPFKFPTSVSGGGPRIGGESISDSSPVGVLPPGVRGLLIAPLKLEGVVREQTANKMIAVVTNETRRAYFLTENESVYNGVVSKITPDAVYFKENVLDANGRVTTREVVKRLVPAPGEGR